MLVFAFSFPSVQTRAAQWLTNDLNETYGTAIKIDKIELTYKGAVKIGAASALDHKKDTVLAFKELETSILSFGDLFAGAPNLGDTRIDGLYFNMVRYKGDKKDNLMQFIDKFSTSPATPSTKPFKLETGNLKLTNARANVIDEQSSLPILFKARNMNLEAQSLAILDSDVNAAITDANFIMFTSAMRYGNEQDGLVVKQLKADFTYTREHICATDLELTTAASTLQGDLALNYGITGFTDFNNKVQWDFSIDRAQVSTNELRYFYNEILPNEQLSLQGDMTGTLNDMVLKNLKAIALNDLEIDGDMHLINLLDNRDAFFIEGTFNKIQASSKDLESFYPTF